MIFRLWRASNTTSKVEASSTQGDLVYAIGDIHGRIDLLDDLIPQMIRDFEAIPNAPKPKLVFLGDYIDRGPDSRSVIDRILDLSTVFDVTALKGNHEDALLRFLDQPEFGPNWVEHGGAETLAAYGVPPPKPDDDNGWSSARAMLIENMPQRHVAFFFSLSAYFTIGDYLFVHAGVRPNVALKDQTVHDMMWIRKPFLEAERPCEKVVVHGHTPDEEPFSGPWRIGVDTGAYASGVLTAVCLYGVERRFLSTRPLWRSAM